MNNFQTHHIMVVTCILADYLFSKDFSWSNGNVQTDTPTKAFVLLSTKERSNYKINKGYRLQSSETDESQTEAHARHYVSEQNLYFPTQYNTDQYSATFLFS